MSRALARNWPVVWIFKGRGLEKGPVTLDQRRIFILPTRHGLLFGVALLVMLLGSINYDNNLGLILTFLLAALATVSILHAYRNLEGLVVFHGATQPVFAGQEARFTVSLENHALFERCAVAVERPGHTPQVCDVPPGQVIAVPVLVRSERRGLLAPGRLTLWTRFPLGLFRAWSTVELAVWCLVYPRPEASVPLPPAAHSESGTHDSHGRGTEDFGGFRGYAPGDSPRHIAWKAAARERGLLTKQFFGQSDSTLWLDWDTAQDLEPEARLSRLCRWVLDADAAGFSYGLRLPGTVIGPAHGDEHRHACLKALALFRQPGNPR